MYCYLCKRITTNTCCSNCMKYICPKCLVKRQKKYIIYYYCKSCIRD